MSICFFKQKTAYEMRISDWSSDVCSSDLLAHAAREMMRIGLLEAAQADPRQPLHGPLSRLLAIDAGIFEAGKDILERAAPGHQCIGLKHVAGLTIDRKSTRLNSSH